MEVAAVVSRPMFGNDVRDTVPELEPGGHQGVPGHDMAMDQIRFPHFLPDRLEAFLVIAPEILGPFQGVFRLGVVEIVFHDLPASDLFVLARSRTGFGLEEQDMHLVMQGCGLGVFADEEAFHVVGAVGIPSSEE